MNSQIDRNHSHLANLVWINGNFLQFRRNLVKRESSHELFPFMSSMKKKKWVYLWISVFISQINSEHIVKWWDDWIYTVIQLISLIFEQFNPFDERQRTLRKSSIDQNSPSFWQETLTVFPFSSSSYRTKRFRPSSASLIPHQNCERRSLWSTSHYFSRSSSESSLSFLKEAISQK
jgi:hypothetical protein